MTIDWDAVHRSLETDSQHRCISRSYGLPSIGNPISSAFFDGDISPRWDIPDELIVEVAITGAFMRHSENPAQPLTTAEILDQARACAAGGASALHVHVRNDDGYNTLDPDRLASVVEPLREEFPDLFISGCLVCILKGEWEAMQQVLERGLLDGCPLNPTATFVGDTLFAKPPAMIIEKTRLVLEAGVTPQVAVYVDGDVANADRFLYRSGLLEQGQNWLVLPSLPGCSPMLNARQMGEGLLRVSSAIYDTDPEATITVCAAGRASLYLTAMAVSLGLHVRIGMEDTIWLWPHRDDLIESNPQVLELTKLLAQALGRTVAGHARYRELLDVAPRTAPTTT
jgi:3-keto-5-aminohexanoate cleavage enzyme